MGGVRNLKNRENLLRENGIWRDLAIENFCLDFIKKFLEGFVFFFRRIWDKSVFQSQQIKTHINYEKKYHYSRAFRCHYIR